MIPAFIAEALAAIGTSLPVAVLVKATALMGLALLAGRVARRSRAAIRHLIFAAAIAITLVLPIATLIVPAVDVPVPARLSLFERAPATATTAERAGAMDAPVLSSEVAPVSSSVSTSTIVWTIWGTGSALFLLVPVAGLWQIRRLRRRGMPWPYGEAAVRRVASEGGIGRFTSVVLDPSVSGPMTCGLLRPVIVFPPDAPGWSDNDFRRAVIHELEHVRRADWLVHCLARLACAVYWFHPLIWLCAHRLSLEAERACDDAVVRREEATLYAEQLVTFAQRVCARPRGPALAMAGRRDLPVRVAAVLDSRARRGRAGVAWTTGALTAAILIVAVVSPLRTVAGMPIAVGPPRVAAQDVPAILANAPSFDVVSVKPSGPDVQFPGIRPIQPGGRFTAIGMTPRTLMQIAYGRDGGLLESQIIGDAKWLDTERFDIVGSSEVLAAAGDNDFTIARGLLQTLLRERFNARVHAETRSLPIYTLVMSRADRRLGPQLRPRTAPCPAAGSKPSDGIAACGFTRAAPGHWSASIELLLLASNIAHQPDVRRVVRDQTGLNGRFDLELKFTPQIAAATNVANADPDIFTALQEQLGLKLEPTRGSVEVIVIDQVERPAAD